MAKSDSSYHPTRRSDYAKDTPGPSVAQNEWKMTWRSKKAKTEKLTYPKLKRLSTGGCRNLLLTKEQTRLLIQAPTLLAKDKKDVHEVVYLK